MIILDKWNDFRMEEGSTITTYLQYVNLPLKQLKEIDKYSKNSIIIHKILNELLKKNWHIQKCC